MVTSTLSEADLNVIIGALSMMGGPGHYRPLLPYTWTSVDVLTSILAELRDLVRRKLAPEKVPVAFSVCELVIVTDLLAYAIAYLKKDLLEYDIFLRSNPEDARALLARLQEPLVPHEVSLPLVNAPATLLDEEGMITLAGGLVLKARRFRVLRSGPATEGFVFYTYDADRRQLVWWMYPQGVAPFPIATGPEGLLRYYQHRLVTAYRDSALHCAYFCGDKLVVHRGVSWEPRGTTDPKSVIEAALMLIPPIADLGECYLVQKWSWRKERLFTTDHLLFPRIESLEWLGGEWVLKVALKDGTVREVRMNEEFEADLGPYCSRDWIEF